MKKRDLWFQHGDGSFSLVTKDVLEEDVLPTIREYVRKINPKYRIHYVRSWGENPVVYDVGSHVEFFYWGRMKETKN